MAKTTTTTGPIFTDSELLTVWIDASKAEPKRTRREIVETLLKLKKVKWEKTEDTVYKQFSARVNARYTLLNKKGLRFPIIGESPRGKGNAKIDIDPLKEMH